ncbi:unnamed protein product [Paramecium sonneborni]|uniref:Uncharacterized protein n=1 Tax=Paramecium sonneborni TaxID=65129 RepID=A0A8S1RQM9_9CILI|nr:unnamed protein product [Paramecium sonneborni]
MVGDFIELGPKINKINMKKINFSQQATQMRKNKKLQNKINDQQDNKNIEQKNRIKNIYPIIKQSEFKKKVKLVPPQLQPVLYNEETKYKKKIIISQDRELQRLEEEKYKNTRRYKEFKDSLNPEEEQKFQIWEIEFIQVLILNNMDHQLYINICSMAKQGCIIFNQKYSKSSYWNQIESTESLLSKMQISHFFSFNQKLNKILILINILFLIKYQFRIYFSLNTFNYFFFAFGNIHIQVDFTGTLQRLQLFRMISKLIIMTQKKKEQFTNYNIKIIIIY